MKRSLVPVIIGIALLLTACENERPEQPIHPVPEYIPHYDNDHVVVDAAQPIGALEDVPWPIALLADYLEDPEGAGAVELQTFVSDSPWHVRVRAIDEHRLALVTILRHAELEPRVIDHEPPRLVEYDLQTHEYVDLAEEDVDIGDLRQMTDMKLREGVLYVKHNPKEVSRFDCASAPCTYDRTESFYGIDSVAARRAVAPVTDSTLAVFGKWGRTVDRPFAEHYADIVKVFDDEHNLVQAFGSAYNATTNAINSHFTRYAALEYSEEADRFALMYRLFPYLYAYDADGELRASYQFDTEIEPVMEDTGSGRTHLERYNYFERNPRRSYYLLNEIEGMAVVARESIEREDLDDEAAAYRYDYYAIDLAGEEAYHIGTDAYAGEQERLVFVTEAGLVRHDGEAMHFIGL